MTLIAHLLMTCRITQQNWYESSPVYDAQKLLHGMLVTSWSQFEVHE